eukprot:3249669-Amphidinium_carterae.1
MDPSPDEVARWASAEHVATLGLHGGEHWRLLALMPVGAWKIGVEQERVAPSAAIEKMLTACITWSLFPGSAPFKLFR